MSDSPTYCFDTETYPIGPSCLAPQIVCGQLYYLEGPSDEKILIRDQLQRYIPAILKAGIITQFGAFDLACICSNWPEYIPQVFQALDDEKVHDVAIRDKLLMLAKHGCVDNRDLPDGGVERLSYSLAAITLRRLGRDISETKGEHSWRVHFNVLDGMPVHDWPQDAQDYALDDVRLLEEIYNDQEREAAEIDHDVFATQSLHMAASFALYLMSCQGIPVDPVERQRIVEWLESELTPEALAPLFDSGILRMPVPARPHKNQMKKVYKLLDAYGESSEQPEISDDFWECLKDEIREELLAAGIKFTKPKASSKDMKVLADIIQEVCVANGIDIQYTDTGKISTSSEFLDDFDHMDPRLKAYAHRQKFEKILTTELPRMQGDRVHVNFDVLKETGRTSSFGGDLYPSMNGQNVDPQVRGAYIPEPGWVMCSVDYSALELCSFAQKQLQLFGVSTLAELLIDGVDPHAYLGAQMAYEMAQEEFFALCNQQPSGDRIDNYNAFLGLRDGRDEQCDFYAHWRKFAKPVGLGYPGGLGPDTLVTLAKGTYGVILSRDEAASARDLWHRIFPEAADYFRWISNDCALPDGTYWYVSPMGMLRVGASYCAAANGAALQTPAAEGAKLGFFEIIRACYDPTRESILYGCRPWNFVHDENLVNIPEDEFMHERAWEISKLMVEGMVKIIPDIPIKAEPALMRRWNKFAEYVTGEDGRIAIWQPEPKD